MRHYRCLQDILVHSIGELAFGENVWNSTLVRWASTGTWVNAGTIITVIDEVVPPNVAHGTLWKIIVGDVVGWIFFYKEESVCYEELNETL